MFIDSYPYTDFNELNLDYILKVVKACEETIKTQLPDLYNRLNLAEDEIKALEDWVNDFDIYLIQDALAEYLKVGIFVEINNEGYIVYNIPSTWSEIEFHTTGLDYTDPDYDYGHLVLVY